MKFRSLAVALVATATTALSLTGMSPAGAAATDPVTNLTVSQTQVGQNLQITGNWDANPDVTSYRAYITDQADGNGAVLTFKDVSTNAAVITTSSLAAGGSYWLAVKPIAPSAGTVATIPFTAATLDTEGPNGSYTVNRTSGYLLFDFNTPTDDLESAAFTVTQTGLSDNTTAAGSITRTIEAGDGTAAKAWTTGTTTKLTFHKAGTFTPKVRLTDEFGNLTVVNLPTLTVKEDVTNPKVSIKVPAYSTKIASWRRIFGHATDTGTGIDSALAMVIQKRSGVWYAYDFGKQKWIKGSTTIAKTLSSTSARPAVMTVGATSHVWGTPTIRGLTAGTLHVEAVAFDKAFNLGQAVPRNPVLH
ncbi:MAG: hypothetical protein ACJ72O_03295 [Marmoricola sp.]